MQFPLYFIGDNTKFITEEDDGTIEVYSALSGKRQIVDPKFCEGKTLGLRRLQYSPTEDCPKLYKFPLAFPELTDFLLGAKRGTYIDSLGNLHNWQGSRFVRIRSYKIRNSLVSQDAGVVLLTLIGSDKKVVTKYPPPYGYNYACLMELPEGPILAGYSKHKVSSRKKV